MSKLVKAEKEKLGGNQKQLKRPGPDAIPGYALLFITAGFFAIIILKIYETHL